MKRFLWGLTILPLALTMARAHDVITTKLTYTRDISRIFARRCIACHSSESSIPLTTFQQVRPWAVGIKQQVLSREMPPWGAVKGFGNLSPDDGLSEEEIMIIAAWVVGGAPEGYPVLLPKNNAPDVAKPEPSLQDVVFVNTRSNLENAVLLTAIRPTGSARIGSARIVAILPGGPIQPLLWLFHYDPKWRRTFVFRQPIGLPPGTIVQADSPVQFALQSRP